MALSNTTQPTEARHRPVRSFVRREGRLTPAQARACNELWPRFGCDWTPGTMLDLAAVFGNDRPVEVEVGFGSGEALLHLATTWPERNYLGLEVHRPGIGRLLRELARRELTHVRVLCQDAAPLFASGLPAASVHAVYLFFPDPWPKRRHWKRRLVQSDWIAGLARVLAPQGVFYAATDWAPYAQSMLALLENAGGQFVNVAGSGRFAPRPAVRPLTRFERRGLSAGHQVFDLIFQRRPPDTHSDSPYTEGATNMPSQLLANAALLPSALSPTSR